MGEDYDKIELQRVKKAKEEFQKYCREVDLHQRKYDYEEWRKLKVATRWKYKNWKDYLKWVLKEGRTMPSPEDAVEQKLRWKDYQANKKPSENWKEYYQRTKKQK